MLFNVDFFNFLHPLFPTSTLNILPLLELNCLFIIIDIFNVTLSEDSAVGTLALTIQASDTDDSDVISYGLVNPVSLFHLDSVSGQIRLASSLDFETSSSHVLLVTASDGTFVTTATVSVLVQDVNDNEPVFNPIFYRYMYSSSNLSSYTSAVCHIVIYYADS